MMPPLLSAIFFTATRSPLTEASRSCLIFRYFGTKSTPSLTLCLFWVTSPTISSPLEDARLIHPSTPTPLATFARIFTRRFSFGLSSRILKTVPGFSTALASLSRESCKRTVTADFTSNVPSTWKPAKIASQSTKRSFADLNPMLNLFFSVEETLEAMDDFDAVLLVLEFSHLSCESASTLYPSVAGFSLPDEKLSLCLKLAFFEAGAEVLLELLSALVPSSIAPPETPTTRAACA
mmetsp:Transcript_13742/g.39095  ORF Transcript_13742/g.39095 Transcript_13742/m.39095 type:complete len:236 (+) Transcript_13742:224-931(+)